MILADNNFNLGKWSDAVMHYELASNMCPNRYEPLYKLQQITVKEGNKTKAVDIAQKILNMEIKIPSARVNFIRKEMEKYLNNKY